jgi:hypothetical protein
MIRMNIDWIDTAPLPQHDMACTCLGTVVLGNDMFAIKIG